MNRLIDWLFEKFQVRCIHDPNYVSDDILEGNGNIGPNVISVAWCQRCGAVKVFAGWDIAGWRVPHATWTNAEVSMKKMIVRQVRGVVPGGLYSASDEQGKHGAFGDLESHAAGAAITRYPDFWGIEIIREDANGPDGEKK